MPLQSVEPQRLYRQIAGQVRSLITSGEFAPGARLPAERDLASQLGVSRPSVREALIALEVEGWIEVRGGSGVYVRPEGARGGEVAAQECGPLELIRARRVVEGEVAAVAATSAKRPQLRAIGDALDRMREDIATGVAPHDSDRAFHAAIAQATGNTVLAETVQAFWSSRRGVLSERLGDHFETVPSWRAAVAEHQAVLDAILAKDADAARAAMRRHLDKSHARFSASWRSANPT